MIQFYIYIYIYTHTCIYTDTNIYTPSDSVFLFVGVQSLSCVQLFMTPWTVAWRLLCLWDLPDKNTGVDFQFLFQGIFLTQGSNLVLLHWQANSLVLSHQGSLVFPIRYYKILKIVPHATQYVLVGYLSHI